MPLQRTKSAIETETEALGKLERLFDNLMEMKADKTTYIKSAQVLQPYDELSRIVRPLVKYEKDLLELQDGKSKVQVLVHNCYTLISLFYMTIGRTSDPPALYAPSVVIKLLLAHLQESGFFTEKDIQGVADKLDEYREFIELSRDAHIPEMITILEMELDECQSALRPLRSKLESLSPELSELQTKLVSMRRSIRSLESRAQFAEDEVKGYMDELNEIEAQKVNGKFLGIDGSVPEGQEIVQEVFDECRNAARIALDKKGLVAPSLKPIAEEIYTIRNTLEKLNLTQSWSLRETDLYDYLEELTKLDQSRVNGKFVDADGNSPAEGQNIILHMIRKSYSYVFALMNASEPVSEALTPIYNQLQTVRWCLTEVQKTGGLASARDLYPYSMKLSSIDNMRVDGRFIVNGDIPEGQGRLNALLAECFDICYELRTAEADTRTETEIEGSPE